MAVPAAVPARISLVTLGVADLDRSAAFFAALGWHRSSASNEQIVWFKTADSALGLFPYDHLAADVELPVAAHRSGRGFGGITLAINVDTADDVAPALAAAEAAGGRILKPATRADWGGVSGYFADVDGYPWEVAWNPYFPFAPDGHLQLPD